MTPANSSEGDLLRQHEADRALVNAWLMGTDSEIANAVRRMVVKADLLVKQLQDALAMSRGLK